MSPELFKYKPYNYKSDIWALGCVMYEICNLKHAFNAQTLNGLALKILKGNYMPISTKYSQKLRDLIMSMLNVNPKKRPSIFEIIEMPEIKKRVIHYVVGLQKNSQSKRVYDDLYLNAVEDQCKVLGISDQVQQTLNRKSLHMSQMKKSKVAEKNSQSLQKQKQQKEQQLQTSKKLNENLSNKISAIEAKLKSRTGQLPIKDKILYNKQMKKLKEIRDRQEQLEEFREKNIKERQENKEKFRRQNFNSNAIGQVLNGKKTMNGEGQEVDETDKTYGYDDFAEADYGEEGFANESTNLDNMDYDISSEMKPDSPVKNRDGSDGEHSNDRYKEDTNINSLADDELENALTHYRAMLQNNADNIKKLETDIQNTTKQLDSKHR